MITRLVRLKRDDEEYAAEAFATMKAAGFPVYAIARITMPDRTMWELWFEPYEPV